MLKEFIEHIQSTTKPQIFEKEARHLLSTPRRPRISSGPTSTTRTSCPSTLWTPL